MPFLIKNLMKQVKILNIYFNLGINLVAGVVFTIVVSVKPAVATTTVSGGENHATQAELNPQKSFAIKSALVEKDTDLESKLHNVAQSTLPPPPTSQDLQIPTQPQPTLPPSQNPQETQEILNQLLEIRKKRFPTPRYQGRKSSPGLTISNPNGFGADKLTIFLVTDYQRRTRYTKTNDGEMGFGVGLGDARKAVGVELSYTIDSFGSSTTPGTGGFNVKLHRRLANDLAVAVGWNQFARIEDFKGATDYPWNSYYAVATKIFNTKKFIDQPFSRVAVTGGIGGGQFLSESRINDDLRKRKDPTGLNVFGSVTLRAIEPVSIIVEWTGQDLATGLSIAPFKNIPFVITPAIRDIAGAGNGPRFILGTGISLQF